MYILAIDPATNSIVSVPEVLKIIDSEYDFLKYYYAGFAIENVVPAFVQVSFRKSKNIHWDQIY